MFGLEKQDFQMICQLLIISLSMFIAFVLSLVHLIVK